MCTKIVLKFCIIIFIIIIIYSFFVSFCICSIFLRARTGIYSGVPTASARWIHYNLQLLHVAAELQCIVKGIDKDICIALALKFCINVFAYVLS